MEPTHKACPGCGRRITIEIWNSLTPAVDLAKTHKLQIPCRGCDDYYLIDYVDSYTKGDNNERTIQQSEGS